MVKINYKCSSCGGKLTYKDGTTSLICYFCNKTYDNFIKVEDIDFNEFDKQFKISYYNCPKCGFNISAYFFELYGSCQCYNCKSNIQKHDCLIGGVAPCIYSLATVNSLYKKEISSIKKYIPKQFFNPNFKLIYLNSSLYDGVIVISAYSGLFNKKIERKYCFSDIIIPNSNILSNRDKLQFLRNKNRYIDIIFSEQDVEKHLDVDRMDLTFDKKTNLSFIEKACLNEFKSKYKNVTNVKIISSLNIKNNIYIPVYQSETVYEGKNYCNMIIAYKTFDSENIYCFNFPRLSLKDTQKISLNYYFFCVIFAFVKLMFIIPILIFIFFNLFISYNLTMIVVGAFFMLLVVFFPISFKEKLKKEKNLYLNSQDISAECFYSELVDEKNKFVGHI